MDVVWTDPAEDDRDRIVRFVAQDNPQAAVDLDALFTTAADSLAPLSSRGRPGRVPQTRELIVHKHYLIVYSHDDTADRTYIKSVVHSSRQWPPE